MPHPRPGSNYHHYDTGQCVTSDAVRAVLQTPGLPQPLTDILEVISDKCLSGNLKCLDLVNTDCLAQLVKITTEEYEELDGSALAAKQRGLKLKLLTQICTLTLPGLSPTSLTSVRDLSCLTLLASVKEAALRPEEKSLVLGLLTIFLTRCSDRVGERLGEVLGYLSVLSGLHKSPQGVSLVPTNLPHLHFTQTGPPDNRKGSSSCPDTTSDSEYSDQDMAYRSGDEEEYKRKSREGVVEREALHAINIIVKKCQKKEVVSYWFIFLPDQSFSPLQSGVADLTNHPVKKIRQASLSILIDFLSHSSQFLALAQHQEREKTSFTALSSALAEALLVLHRMLIRRLEDSLAGPTELVAILKLVATLSENCSYSRLAPGILETLVVAVMETADRKRNPVVQVGVLSVLVSVCQQESNAAQLKSLSEELFRFMLPRSFPDPGAVVADNNVRYMALQSLSVLTQVDIQTFLKRAPEVKKLIDTSLTDPDSSVVLHTFRFIKNFTRHLTLKLESENQDCESKLRNLANAFWIDFLKPANFQLLDKHINANIKSAFCDCLAEMGSRVYSNLPEAKKIVCITYVLGQCSSETSPTTSAEAQIQARAALSSCLRTLGIFVMFPCYLTDTPFHIDVADAILPHIPVNTNKVKKPGGKGGGGGGGGGGGDLGHKTVRVAASWALANLTDVLLQAEKERINTGEPEEFPLELVVRILQSAVSSATDTASAVNTKSNSVRCIGNMLNYLKRGMVTDPSQYDDLMEKGARALIANITSGKIMKIRWNACYAASNILKKEEGEGKVVVSPAWRTDLISCLLQMVENFQNFKVRTNAALALGSVVQRVVLGSQYMVVFTGLINSLDTAQNLEVFGEWQHQANLVNQLCISICKLLSFVESQQEFTRLVQLLTNNWDLVDSSFRAAAKRIPPERFGPFLEAGRRLAELPGSRDSGSETETAVHQLISECTHDFGL